MQILQILRGPDKEFENPYYSYFLLQVLREIYLRGVPLFKLASYIKPPIPPPPHLARWRVKVWKIAFLAIFEAQQFDLEFLYFK